MFDASTRPLCRLNVGKKPTADEFATALSDFEDELGRKSDREICLLADATATVRLDLVHVKTIARFGEEHHSLLAERVRALVLVIPSAMVRGAIKVAFQLKAPPHPYAVVQTIDEATDYLAPYLREISPV